MSYDFFVNYATGNLIPTLIERQTWKQYPVELYLREWILVVHWKQGKLHQFMGDNEIRELVYTW